MRAFEDPESSGTFAHRGVRAPTNPHECVRCKRAYPTGIARTSSNFEDAPLYLSTQRSFLIFVANHPLSNILIRWAHAVMLLPLALTACGRDSEHAAWIDGSKVARNPVDIGPCETGQVRSCGVKLDARLGIVTCYRGQTICQDGVWGECVNGQTLALRASSSLTPSTARFLALSTPSECQANPCDPRCQAFDEKPIEPIQSTVLTPIFDWVTGSIGALPGGLASKGMHEPCSLSSDCQFNSYCRAPTKGSCAHSVCATGDALDSGCNDCTTAVCAANPSCCDSAPATSSCSHDPCVTGPSLSSSCNPCVSKICAKMPSCCSSSGSWTSSCAAEVANTCGLGCGCAPGERAFNGNCYSYKQSGLKYNNAQAACTAIAPNWNLVKIDNSAENDFVYQTYWGAPSDFWLGINDASAEGKWRWPQDPSTTYWQAGQTPPYTNWSSASANGATLDCAIMNRHADPTWYYVSCGAKYPYLCEGPRHVMQAPVAAAAWSSTCVDLVKSQCGAVCDEANPDLATGKCTPWYPGDKNMACDKADLAVGTPCAGSLPICNHGSVAAPAGGRIVHFPANSQQYPNCTPDQTHPQMVECFTSQPIPPGMCIDLTDCSGISGNREIMVNPGGPGATPECNCADNWSVYSGGTCGEPVCAGGSSAATPVKRPIDIVFIIDNSSSMTEEIVQVQNRINQDFAQIIGASEIDYRVIMFSRYGDVLKAVGGSDHPICVKKPLGGNDCTVPSTEKLVFSDRFYHYSADVESWNSWCLLLGTYKLADEGGATGRTWSAMAPKGWSEWLRPDAFKVFVEITDDDVSCTNFGYSFNDKSTSKDGQTAAANFDSALMKLDPAQFGTAANRNYVWHSIVGMVANTPSTLPWKPTDSIKTSKCSSSSSDGPGTGYQALSILTGGLRYPTCNYTDFNAVFNAIATEVIGQSKASCDFALPPSDGKYDPLAATVNYSSTAGNKESVTALTKVASSNVCTKTGWYYDNPTAPTMIKLCADVCSLVKADPTARVVVEFGCQNKPAPITKTFIYSGTCEEGSENVWLDLGFNATVYDDGAVTFRARVADTEVDLATAEWVALGSATATKQSCSLSSGCAIDVFEALGAQMAQTPFLELEITVSPSTTLKSPLLNEFGLTYSCVYHM